MTKKLSAKDKQEHVMKGVGFSSIGYILLGFLLFLMGVPGFIIFSVMLVLFWGLATISYAYYYHK